MPPWKPEPGYGDFVGGRRLTAEELETIRSWASSGAARGPGHEVMTLPLTMKRVPGPPDLVARMPETFELPADGPDIFRLFVVPIPVDAPRFVKTLEFSPGTRAVHHATMLVDETPTSRQRDAEDPAPGYNGDFAPTADYPDGHFLGWAPGQQPPPAERQLPWRLNPGTDLVIQLHLKPTGKREQVRVAVSLFFGSDPPSEPLTMLRLAREDIDIPPGAANFPIDDSFVLPVDSIVHAVQPHAHYRATNVRAFATLPDGTRQWLISIPNWDFDWQDMYYFRDPLRLPKGTTVSMQYTFDNSADNPRNPQLPPKRVRWGQSSTDEMAEMLLQLSPASAADLHLLREALRQKHHRDTVTGYETRLSLSPDDVHLHDDVAQLYLEDGRVEDALHHLRESVRLMPQSAVRHVNLGKALIEAGQLDRAAAAFEAALQMAPADVAARLDLGVVRALQGRINDALDEYNRVLAIDPGNQEAHNNLSAILLYLGRIEDAHEHARRALELQPDFPAARYNMARVLLARGQMREARQHFELALKGRPDWPAALKEYAWWLATDPDREVRDPVRAVVLAARAVQLTNRRDPTLLDVLAAAYASAGRFDEAVRTANVALDLVRGDQNRERLSNLRRHFELYRTERQVVDPTRRYDP